MNKHTPPLIDLYDGTEDPKDAQFLVDRLGISQVKAACIVRVVNTYEKDQEIKKELVAALKDMRDNFQFRSQE